jgi:ATP-dependent Lon protease
MSSPISKKKKSQSNGTKKETTTTKKTPLAARRKRSKSTDDPPSPVNPSATLNHSIMLSHLPPFTDDLDDPFDPEGISTTGKKKKKKLSLSSSGKNPSSLSDPAETEVSAGDSPAFLLIPILSDFNGDENGQPEISMEDALEYPIGTSLGRKKPLLRSIRKKSPLKTRLEKAKEDLDAYNRLSSLDIRSQPLKDQILLMDLDLSVKSTILKKFEDSEKSRNSFDQSKFMNWAKDLVQLPFGKSVPLPVTIEEGPTKILEYLQKAKKQLDAAIAGQENAKEEVLDFIAKLISNPAARGNILALSGSPGTGKTKLVRKGIAEALGRPFHVINLGGMNDVHVISGHDVTYSGAKYGRISQILIQSRCDNPVIYLDELDKVQSGSDKGMEIFRILTHILDEEQNHEFLDEYFSGVKIDLSKVLFVASMNDVETVDPVLLDRLKVVRVDELDLTTKIVIGRNYMLPELCNEVRMDLKSIVLSDDLMKYIIVAKTEEEKGCRKLKRNLETIVQKLNTQRITQTGYFLVGASGGSGGSSSSSTGVKSGKIVLTEKMVDDLLKRNGGGKHSFGHIYS